MRIVAAALAFCIWAPGASAQQADDRPPQQCVDVHDTAGWQACLNALPANSPWRPLALINLGSDAFMRDDYASAVRYYDEARPAGQQMISDIVFHTFRSVALLTGCRTANARWRQRRMLLPCATLWRRYWLLSVVAGKENASCVKRAVWTQPPLHISNL